MLPPEAIKEFKQIYLQIYGIKLSEKEAILRANNLVRLYKIVLGNSGSTKAKENEYRFNNKN